MLMRMFFMGLLGLGFIACEHDPKECIFNAVYEAHLLDSLEAIELEQRSDSLQNALLEKYHLVDVVSLNSSIRVDLKYADSLNFMKMKLYQKLDKAYLQEDVAERLDRSQRLLSKLHPSYHLLVYDGVRPVSVQQKMWDALDTIPDSLRSKFVSNPANHSIHNYGAAVDLTICDENGIPLDMGAAYDDIREIAYPKLEGKFLASGELSLQQVTNRKLLRKVMAAQGFTPIQTEWWHFNACSRNKAKEKYPLMEEE